MSVTAQSCLDFRTVSEFRKRHLQALSGLFVQVLALCRKSGLGQEGENRADRRERQTAAAERGAEGQGTTQFYRSREPDHEDQGPLHPGL
jgi:hypothetical protein